MKMSDYFGELSLCGDCIEDDSFHYATTSCKYVVNGVDAGEAICHAINNHDKLVRALNELYYACKNNTGAHPSFDCYEYSLDRVKALLKELEK